MKQYAVWSHSVAVGNTKIAQAFGYMDNNQVIQQDKQQACPCREAEQPLCNVYHFLPLNFSYAAFIFFLEFYFIESKITQEIFSQNIFQA